MNKIQILNVFISANNDMYRCLKKQLQESNSDTKELDGIKELLDKTLLKESFNK